LRSQSIIRPVIPQPTELQRIANQIDAAMISLIITRNCRNSIRTLPAMTYDKTHPEDIDPACEEHAVKALMYGLTRRKMSGGTVRVKWSH
jgi:hypothetical protein